ncbi:SixA phosphatase family protein [Serinicoccus kebangsaanensis]|uniref:SixA phosphatase family protein n=1 Tax=Serinicoccus kebangsaanensis TaxID=2602069 RepID=UPI00178C34BF|nr:histidine phosphatase family protein [Serinicoccus kebangsaanensis]
MSRTLVLVRHAKAEGAHPGGDHERRLAERGWRDAEALGEMLVGQGRCPDLVLVSTAVRARETLRGLLGPREIQTWATRRIYDGGVDGVAEAIREVPDEVEVLWVVGHEPVMSTSAWDLGDADTVPEVAREQLSSGLSTSSAAVLELDLPWSEIGHGSARLVDVHTGRGADAAP